MIILTFLKKTQWCYFFAKSYGSFEKQKKEYMVNYAFPQLDSVLFHMIFILNIVLNSMDIVGIR